MALDAVELQTKKYADARALLNERVMSLNDKLEQLKRTYLRGIKTALSEAKEQRGILEACVEENREAFTRPRTHVFHGIKVGFQKGKGKVSFADKDRTLKLIRKNLPELAEALIKTSETPNKAAMVGLSGHDLKQIGACLSGAGDHVAITPTDSDVDKLVEAMLADDEDTD